MYLKPVTWHYAHPRYNQKSFFNPTAMCQMSTLHDPDFFTNCPLFTDGAIILVFYSITGFLIALFWVQIARHHHLVLKESPIQVECMSPPVCPQVPENCPIPVCKAKLEVDILYIANTRSESCATKGKWRLNFNIAKIMMGIHFQNLGFYSCPT